MNASWMRTNNRIERRNRLVILLLYGCGLRTAELCQLDLGDVDLERQEIVIRHGKGDRARRLPVPDAVWTVLLAYLAERKGQRGALIRTEQKQKRLASKDVCEVVSAAAQAAGLRPTVTPKTLRHSFATHLMDRGVDLAVIASLMGHRSPQETGVYLHGLPGRRENAVKLLTNHWYLFAFDVKRQAMRTFALPRLKSPEITTERFTIPKKFNLSEYLKGSLTVFKGDADYEIVVDFDSWGADLIRGRKWHASQEITELPRRQLRLRLRLNNIEEAERWVLSWGTHATVVRPQALAHRLHEIGKTFQSRYDP